VHESLPCFLPLCRGALPPSIAAIIPNWDTAQRRHWPHHLNTLVILAQNSMGLTFLAVLNLVETQTDSSNCVQLVSCSKLFELFVC
jgi:hypothetical protein